MVGSATASTVESIPSINMALATIIAVIRPLAEREAGSAGSTDRRLVETRVCSASAAWSATMRAGRKANTTDPNVSKAASAA